MTLLLLSPSYHLHLSKSWVTKQLQLEGSMSPKLARDGHQRDRSSIREGWCDHLMSDTGPRHRFCGRHGEEDGSSSLTEYLDPLVIGTGTGRECNATDKMEKKIAR